MRAWTICGTKYLDPHRRGRRRGRRSRTLRVAGGRQEGRGQPEDARAGQDDARGAAGAGPEAQRAEGRDQLARSPPRRRRWPMPRWTSGCAAEWLDVTLPGRPRRTGTIHPVSQVTEEVTAIFADMGFAVAEGPQIETDWYNFDALNIPAPPPRAGRDGHVLHAPRRGRRPPAARAAHPHLARCRSGTWKSTARPAAIIAPGRVYRADYDQTHTPMFHQVEGLAHRPRHLDGEPEMGAGGVLRRPSSRSTASRPASAPRTSPSPNPRPRSTSSAPGRAAS